MDVVLVCVEHNIHEKRAPCCARLRPTKFCGAFNIVGTLVQFECD